ncbi:MAG: hypothetical protein P8124_13820, partial [Gammaproteobacteria bacterium]
EYTSFPWMKQNEHRFEARSVGRVPPLKSGAMIRTGDAGQAKSDGMTDDIASHFRQTGSRICADPRAIGWFYEGGELP